MGRWVGQNHLPPGGQTSTKHSRNGPMPASGPRKRKEKQKLASPGMLNNCNEVEWALSKFCACTQTSMPVCTEPSCGTVLGHRPVPDTTRCQRTRYLVRVTKGAVPVDLDIQVIQSRSTRIKFQIRTKITLYKEMSEKGRPG